MADPNKLCLGCMHELAEGQKFCERCGWNNETSDNKAHQLKPGTILQGKYLVGKVIGEGGFGITYVGWNILLEEKIAIKESYPHSLVARDSTVKATVLPYTGREDYVEKFKKDFLKEAKTMYMLKRVDGIVEIKDVFTENNTVYIVMEYVEGPTLKEYVAQRGNRLPMDEALKIVAPMMEALEQVHNAGLIHRDISPENIKSKADGSAVLLDFGAARQISSEGQRSLTIEVKHGYAPFEQYQTHGKQGPWTDVYALCATIYKLITGETPPSASDRMPDDIIKRPSELGAKISPEQEEVLLKGLAVGVNSRIQTVAELRERLFKTVEKTDEKLEVLYNSAKVKMEEDNIESLKTAIALFTSLKGFGDSAELVKHCRNRISELEKAGNIYKTAKAKMAEGRIDSLKKAADIFASIKGFEDSADLLKECQSRIAEIEGSESVYRTAKVKMAEGSVDSLKRAIELFASIEGYGDSSRQISICERKIEEIGAKKFVKTEDNKEDKSVLPVIIVVAVIAVAIIGIVIALGVSSMFGNTGNIPEDSKTSSSVSDVSEEETETSGITEPEISETESSYLKAVEFYNSGKYEEAKVLFESIKEFEDSAEYLDSISIEEDYIEAVELYDKGDLEGAKVIFEALEGHKEAESYLENIALEQAYLEAMDLYNNGKYGKAADAFNGITGYKDSADWAAKSTNEKQYQDAYYLYNIGSYKAAKDAFEKLGNYKDSYSMIEKCNKKIEEAASSGNSGNTGNSGSGNVGGGSSGGSNIGGGGSSGGSNIGGGGSSGGSNIGGGGSSGGSNIGGGGSSGGSANTISTKCPACGNIFNVSIPAGTASGDYVYGDCNKCGAMIPVYAP